MCDEAVEKQLELWIHEMMTKFKKNKGILDSIVVRLKDKENYSHITQENVNPSQVVLTVSHTPEGDMV